MIQFPVKQVFPERHVQRVSAAFPQAMEQMKNGGRITSPMWKLFPRLRVLARSRTSEVFSVLDLQQAKAYLSHPVLGKMLTEFCEALLTNPSRKEPEFLSPLCATELQASMTLFAMVGGKNSIFQQILDEFFAGETDLRTVVRLTRDKAMVIRDGVLLDCFGYAGELVIPEGVTAIEQRAFFAQKELHTVILPEGLERIGSSAFAYCSNLVSVRMPETVQSIESSAFFQCASLRDIKLPENLTELGQWAFCECDSLTTINIPKNLRGVDTKAFDHLCLLNEK